MVRLWQKPLRLLFLAIGRTHDGARSEYTLNSQGLLPPGTEQRTEAEAFGLDAVPGGMHQPEPGGAHARSREGDLIPRVENYLRSLVHKRTAYYLSRMAHTGVVPTNRWLGPALLCTEETHLITFHVATLADETRGSE